MAGDSNGEEKEKISTRPDFIKPGRIVRRISDGKLFEVREDKIGDISINDETRTFKGIPWLGFGRAHLTVSGQETELGYDDVEPLVKA